MIQEALLHQLEGDHIIASLVEIEEWTELINETGEVVDTCITDRRYEARIAFVTTDDVITQILPSTEPEAMTAFHAVFSSYEEVNGVEPDIQPEPMPLLDQYASNPLYGRF